MRSEVEDVSANPVQGLPSFLTDRPKTHLIEDAEFLTAERNLKKKTGQGASIQHPLPSHCVPSLFFFSVHQQRWPPCIGI